jgi:hypothetical protein
MWLLIVIALSNTSNLNSSKGSLQVSFNSQEECLQAKEQFKQVKGNNYRVSANCIFRGNY